MSKFLDEAGVITLWGKIKSADKANSDAIDAINNGDKELVTPTISANWTICTQDGSPSTSGTLDGKSTSTSNNITVEVGYTAKFSGTWKWSSATGKKDPTGCTGSWATVLPTSGVASSSISKTATETTTISQTITAPKAGLMYNSSTGKITKASGNDSKSASAKVTFGYRTFYGVVDAGTPTAELIKKAAGLAITTSKTLNVTASATTTSQMYIYAYPTSWGRLTAISKDGVDAVLSAFNIASVIYTNNSGNGASVPYTVYYSGAGALNSQCTLKFE